MEPKTKTCGPWAVLCFDPSPPVAGGCQGGLGSSREGSGTRRGAEAAASDGKALPLPTTRRVPELSVASVTDPRPGSAAYCNDRAGPGAWTGGSTTR